MKKIIFVLFMIISVQSFAVNYYVSPAGNNSNNGLTITSTFQ